MSTCCVAWLQIGYIYVAMHGYVTVHDGYVDSINVLSTDQSKSSSPSADVIVDSPADDTGTYVDMCTYCNKVEATFICSIFALY